MDNEKTAFICVLIFFAIGCTMGAIATSLVIGAKLDERDRQLRISASNYGELESAVNRIGAYNLDIKAGLKRIGNGIEQCAGIIRESKVTAGNGTETLRKAIANLKRITEAVGVLEGDYYNIRRELDNRDDNPGIQPDILIDPPTDHN